MDSAALEKGAPDTNLPSQDFRPGSSDWHDITSGRLDHRLTYAILGVLGLVAVYFLMHKTCRQ